MSNTQDKEIRIGLVEDQHLFRQGLKAILERWPNFNVTFESPNGYSVIDKLEKEEELPDVILLDLSLPSRGHEEYNGDRVLLELKRQYPEMKVVILSVHEDEYFIAKLIEMGANGYLVKDSDPQEVHDAVESVYTSGSYINQRSLQATQNQLKGDAKKPIGVANTEVNTSFANLPELVDVFAELFSNTLKHTNASRIQIELEQKEGRFHFKHNGLSQNSIDAAPNSEKVGEMIKALNGELESSSISPEGLFNRITLKLNN